MEDDVLSRVIAVEKEIQARIEAERARMTEWLEKAKAEQENKLLEEEARIKEETARSFGEAVKDAENRASVLLEEASEEEASLERADDQLLMPVIMRHIGRILPAKAP